MEQQKQIVTQSNSLVEAQYRLDLIPQKLVRYIVSMITPSDTIYDRKYYRVNIAEFGKYIGWQVSSGKLFDDIRRIAETLKTTKIKIVKPGTIIETSWIASFEYPKNKGWIEFELSGKLEVELFQLKSQFTQYYLQNICKLKHTYSIRLYELINQYRCIGKRDFDLDNLKISLGINNEEYKQYGKFKQVVLEPSINEILLKTDIDFKWEEKKESRKIIAIVFYDIHKKSQSNIPEAILSLLPPAQRESKQVLNTIEKYIASNGENYIIEKITYTNSRNPENWTDYFFRACENNYGDGYKQDNQAMTQESTQPEKIEIKEGVEIEINGVKHRYEDGYVQTENGVIPQGLLNQMLKNGEAKFV